MLKVNRARIQAIFAAQQPRHDPNLPDRVPIAEERNHAGHGFDLAVRIYGRDAAYVDRVQCAERHKRNSYDQ